MAAAMVVTCGCGKKPAEVYAEGDSNLVVVQPTLPVKVYTMRDMDTIIQDGVVLNIAELSYEVWEKTDVQNNGGAKASQTTLHGICLVFNADWVDLGLLQSGVDILNRDSVEYVLADGGTVAGSDADYSDVSMVADAHGGNAVITYQWFSPAAAGDNRPVAVRVPLTFAGETGQVGITVELELNRYPW